MSLEGKVINIWTGLMMNLQNHLLYCNTHLLDYLLEMEKWLSELHCARILQGPWLMTLFWQLYATTCPKSYRLLLITLTISTQMITYTHLPIKSYKFSALGFSALLLDFLCIVWGIKPDLTYLRQPCYLPSLWPWILSRKYFFLQFWDFLVCTIFLTEQIWGKLDSQTRRHSHFLHVVSTF